MKIVKLLLPNIYLVKFQVAHVFSSQIMIVALQEVDTGHRGLGQIQGCKDAISAFAFL